jgi:hypothetical protein
VEFVALTQGHKRIVRWLFVHQQRASVTVISDQLLGMIKRARKLIAIMAQDERKDAKRMWLDFARKSVCQSE